MKSRKCRSLGLETPRGETYVPSCVLTLILSSTQAWRTCFVASLPRLCNCAIRKNALRTFSENFKRNLQNTQTAPLAAVCTATLKLGHRTTNKNVTESLSDSLFSLSLCLCLTELCYAILCVCQNSVTLSCENVPKWVKTWVCVCTFHDAECTFILAAPLSDGDTWRHATHI